MLLLVNCEFFMILFGSYQIILYICIIKKRKTNKNNRKMESQKRLELLRNAFAGQVITFDNTERAEFVTITPEIASFLVSPEINSLNRKLGKSTVTTYRKQMDAGRWLEHSGESIKISRNGVLLDGQHRLKALIASKKTLIFLVVTGLNPSAFFVLDTGKKRNSSDLLKIEGVPSAQIKSPAITLFFAIQKNYKASEGFHRGRMGISNQDILEEYQSRPDFWDDLYVKAKEYSDAFQKILIPSFIMGWYATLNEIDHDKADQFIGMLCTGREYKDGPMLNSKHVVQQLRNILEKGKRSAFLGGINSTTKHAYMVKTWHLFLTGKKVGKLSVKQDEKLPSLFVVKGKAA